MNPVLGIDVSKVKLDVALRLANGKFRSKVISNDLKGFTELSAWLGKFDVSGLHVCMEATGTYWETVAEHLSDAKYTVSVVNPSRIKAYGASRQVRTKTDAIDSHIIAEFCASQTPEPWTPPSPSIRELRALVARRDALVSMRTQEQNRLLVARESVRENIESLIEHLNAAIASIESDISERVDNDPDLKGKRDLLDSIPGLEKSPSRSSCPFFADHSASELLVKLRLSPDWTPASTNPAPA